MVTPNEITIILHYHTCPQKHPQHDAVAVKNARERYLSEGMIVPYIVNDSVCSDVFITTEKGNKFVEMLCATPFPVTKHVDPRESS